MNTKGPEMGQLWCRQKVYLCRKESWLYNQINWDVELKVNQAVALFKDWNHTVWFALLLNKH